MELKIPIGLDDFKKMIEDGYAYVDKTLLIEEVLNNSATAQLITRPRRFGKTLNMSMLANFFDIDQDNRHLFKGLNIEARPAFQICGTRPTIFLSFKRLKAGDEETFIGLYQEMMVSLFDSYPAIVPHLSKSEKALYDTVLSRRASKAQLQIALANLMYWLERTHGQKVILLIDEYDTPIQEAFSYGYYDAMIPFMRGVLGEALKTNTALEKAVLTGILRVATESIFSDLNNVEVFSVLSYDFSNQFGFTEDEVDRMLQKADYEDKAELIREWYNGYQIGETVIYNPWSVLNYLKKWRQGPQNYWVNTSSNSLIYKQVIGASSHAQDILKALMNGGTVETHLSEHTVLRDLGINDTNLWSLLLFSGYLTVRSSQLVNKRTLYTLAIPNLEVQSLFETIFLEWMQNNIGTPGGSGNPNGIFRVGCV